MFVSLLQSIGLITRQPQMRREFRKLFAKIIYGLLLSIAFVSAAFADLSDFYRYREGLTFIVTPSKAEYDPSEKIVLTLTLRLNKHFPAQATVDTFDPNTISVVSATRNGKPIEPALGIVRYVDDPVYHQILSLTTIGPGDQATIPFHIPALPGKGSRLIVVQLNPESEHVALFYSLAEPGWYTLQFRYLYIGPDSGKPNVFRGELRSNPVTFRIRQDGHKRQSGTADGLQCLEPIELCQELVEKARSTPSAATDISVLEALPQTVYLQLIDDATSGTFSNAAESLAEGQTMVTPNGTTVQGTRTGSDSVIVLNMDPDGDTVDGTDETPRDVDCELVHEAAHAMANAMGLSSSEKAPGAKKVSEDEVIATQEQNICLMEKEMKPRMQYCQGNEDGSQECVKVPPTVSPN
jgi:hypothetical protein